MGAFLPVLLIGGAIAAAMSGGNEPDLPEVPDPVAIPEAPKVPEIALPQPQDILSDTADRREVSRSKTATQRRLANSLTSADEEAGLVDVKNLLGK